MLEGFATSEGTTNFARKSLAHNDDLSGTLFGSVYCNRAVIFYAIRPTYIFDLLVKTRFFDYDQIYYRVASLN